MIGEALTSHDPTRVRDSTTRRHRARVVVVDDTRRRTSSRRASSTHVVRVLVFVLVMAKTRRRKRRTHVDADAGPHARGTNVPRTFVFRRGRMADAVKDLSDDVRKVRARVVEVVEVVSKSTSTSGSERVD